MDYYESIFLPPGDECGWLVWAAFDGPALKGPYPSLRYSQCERAFSLRLFGFHVKIQSPPFDPASTHVAQDSPGKAAPDAQPPIKRAAGFPEHTPGAMPKNGSIAQRSFMPERHSRVIGKPYTSSASYSSAASAAGQSGGKSSAPHVDSATIDQLENERNKMLADMPKPVEEAVRFIVEKLETNPTVREYMKKHGMAHLDPNKIYFHMFGNQVETSHATFNGWSHHAKPNASFTLTEMVMRNFSASERARPDNDLNMQSGVYVADASAGVYDERNEFPLTAVELRDAIHGFYEQYTDKLAKFWSAHERDLRAASKMGFVNAARRSLIKGELSERDYETVMKAAAGNVPLREAADPSQFKAFTKGDPDTKVYAFDVYGYPSTDIRYFVDKEGHAIRYIPGNAQPFKRFDSVEEMREGTIKELADKKFRKEFLSHWSLYHRQDGYSKGVDTAVDDMVSDAWSHKYLNYEPKEVDGDVFDDMTASRKNRMESDADVRIKSDAEVSFDGWVNDIGGYADLLAPFALVGGPVVAGFGLAFQAAHAILLGIKAATGDTGQERKDAGNALITEAAMFAAYPVLATLTGAPGSFLGALEEGEADMAAAMGELGRTDPEVTVPEGQIRGGSDGVSSSVHGRYEEKIRDIQALDERKPSMKQKKADFNAGLNEKKVELPFEYKSEKLEKLKQIFVDGEYRNGKERHDLTYKQLGFLCAKIDEMEQAQSFASTLRKTQVIIGDWRKNGAIEVTPAPQDFLLPLAGEPSSGRCLPMVRSMAVALDEGKEANFSGNMFTAAGEKQKSKIGEHPTIRALRRLHDAGSQLKQAGAYGEAESGVGIGKIVAKLESSPGKVYYEVNTSQHSMLVAKQVDEHGAASYVFYDPNFGMAKFTNSKDMEKALTQHFVERKFGAYYGQVGKSPAKPEFNVRQIFPDKMGQYEIEPGRTVHDFVNEELASAGNANSTREPALPPTSAKSGAFPVAASGGPSSMRFDLEQDAWRTPDGKYWWQSATDRTWKSGTVEEFRSADQYESPYMDNYTIPAIPAIPAPAETMPVPKTAHYVWVGGEMPKERIANIVNNAKLSNDYRHVVHMDVAPADFERIKQEFERVFPGRGKNIEVRNLADEPFYASFRSSESFEPYQFFKASTSKNLAAASDVLRFRLLDEYGGIYLDSDDSLTAMANGELRAKPGDILLGSTVSLPYGSRPKGFNTSVFATLPNNPRMKDISKEIVDRFNRDKAALENRPWAAKGASEEELKRYYDKVFETTGPSMFNDVLEKHNPELMLLDSKLNKAHELNQKVVLDRELAQLMLAVGYYQPLMDAENTAVLRACMEVLLGLDDASINGFGRRFDQLGGFPVKIGSDHSWTNTR